MPATKIGDRVVVISVVSNAPGFDTEAIVCAVETSYILLELVGKKDQWGEPVRKWFEKGLFDGDSQGVIIIPRSKNDDA